MMGGHRLLSSGCGQGQVTGCGEHCNEHMGSIKWRIF